MGLGRPPTVAWPGCLSCDDCLCHLGSPSLSEFLSRDAVLSRSGTGPVSRVLRGGTCSCSQHPVGACGQTGRSLDSGGGGVMGIEVRSVQASLVSIVQRLHGPQRASPPRPHRAGRSRWSFLLLEADSRSSEDDALN